LERKKHGTSEEAVGVTKIYEKLEILNRGVRRSAEVCFSMSPLHLSSPHFLSFVKEVIMH